MLCWLLRADETEVRGLRLIGLSPSDERHFRDELLTTVSTPRTSPLIAEDMIASLGLTLSSSQTHSHMNQMGSVFLLPRYKEINTLFTSVQ